LQWSSESLHILNRLSQIVSELPLLLVGNYRVEESPQLPQELPMMKAIRLNRLSEKDIAKLSSAMLGKAASQNEELLSLLNKESEGNVYFIVEVMKALAEEAGHLDDIAFLALPERLAVDGIVALIERRLGRVPEAAQELLELAAVIGRQVDVGLLECILPHSDVQRLLSDSGEAAILEVQDEQWRFAHDKLRESLLARLPEAKRQGLHRQVATSLESYKADDSPALAYHWRQAGEIEKEAHYAYQAAQLALQSYAYSDAIAYLERSLELVNDAEKRTEMQHQLAESYLAVSNLEKTIDYFEKTLASLGYKISHSPVILLLNISWEAMIQGFHRFLPKSWFLGRDKPRLKRAALIYQQLAEIFYTRLQVLESAYSGIRATNLAEKLDEESSLLALIYGSMCILMSTIPWHRAARLYYRLSREVQTEQSDLAARGWAYLLNGLYDTATTDWENAQKNCLHGAELLKSVGHQRRWEMCLEQTGVAAYMNGRYQESRAYYEQSLPTAKRRNDYQVLDWACFGILAGQVKQKHKDIWKMSHFAEEILPMSPGTAEQIYGYGVLAWAYWRQDDYIKARENAEACLKRARASLPFAFYNMEGYGGMCWVFLRLWEILPEDAALKKAAGQACFALRIFAMIYPLGKARYYLMDGLNLHLNGKHEAAQKRWQKALATAKAAKMPYDEGLAYFEMARHSDVGAERNEMFKSAREIFTQIDASYELEAIREYEQE
jgi:eukaryotic-like serine/threonine-protein kinase